MFEITCFDIWRHEEETCKIITLCKQLDETLGGGIAMGLMTEFCGAPGSGKTTMCLQLCVNVQLPKEVGGLGGKALYLDTNQGFNPERLKEIGSSLEKRLKTACSKMSTEITNVALPSTVNTKTILENIGYIYCGNYTQLLAGVINLKQILANDSEVKLIVIDSFSYPLRHIEDVSERSRINYEILMGLQKLAMDFQVAIVITNEITTHVAANNWTIRPALGDSHAHKINQRIIFKRELEFGYYLAIVDKSVTSPRVNIPFAIKHCGIRGISK